MIQYEVTCVSVWSLCDYHRSVLSESITDHSRIVYVRGRARSPCVAAGLMMTQGAL